MAKKHLTLVSSNPNKVKELRSFFPEWILNRQALDIDEPQTLDLLAICRHKALRAFSMLQTTVMVEDTEFCLEALNGLPGPFIKFFEMKLGKGALIHLLKGHQDRRGEARSCLMVYDGKTFYSGFGTLTGSVTEKVFNGEGFGFDCCFIPKGETLTLSELGMQMKKAISHRTRAIHDLKAKLLAGRSEGPLEFS